MYTVKTEGTGTSLTGKEKGIAILPLAAGCLWFKKSCCFSPELVNCLSPVSQCCCFHTSLTFHIAEETKLHLLCLALQVLFFLSGSSSYLVF